MLFLLNSPCALGPYTVQLPFSHTRHAVREDEAAGYRKSEIRQMSSTVEAEEKKTEVKRGRPRTTNVLGSNTKEKVLESYRSLIRERRTADVSLDDICRRADVKKGSLLYHFGSKEGIQKIIVERYVDHLEACYQAGMQAAEEQWPDHAPAIAGFVEWFRTYSQVKDPTYSEYGLAVLSLTAGNETLIAPVNRWYESVFARIRAASEGNRKALVAVLALEGLFLLGHFRVKVLASDELNAVLDDLLVFSDKSRTA